MAMRRGKTGAGLPAIIWNAGIMSSGPATIESPGAIATSASRSMMIPKDRLRRLCISQARVKWFAGASSCSRCNTAEVGPSPVGSTRRSRHQERHPRFMIGRPMSPSSNPKPLALLAVLGAMLPIVERGQSMDGELTKFVGVPLAAACSLENSPSNDSRSTSS